MASLAEVGVLAVSGDEIPMSYFLPSAGSSFDPDLVGPLAPVERFPDEVAAVIDRAFVFWKPPTGGLWTSYATSAPGAPVRTAWTDWLDDEGDPPRGGLVALRAASDAVVIRVDGPERLAAVGARFPSEFGPFSFEAVRACGVDGIELTWEGWASVGRGLAPLAGWDMESTLWFTADRLRLAPPFPDPPAV